LTKNTSGKTPSWLSRISRVADLSVYRLLGFFSVLGLLALYPFYPNDAVDPLAARVALVVLGVGVSSASYFSPFFKRNLVLVANVCFYLIAGWSFGLVYANQFSPVYVLTSCIIAMITLVAVRSWRPLLLYSLYLTVGAALVSLLAPNGTSISPMLYAGAVVVMVAFVAATSSFRAMESSSMLSRKEFLKEVLNETPDAILVVDPSTHLVLDANRKAAKLFQADKEQPMKEEFIQFLKPHLPLANLSGDRREIQRELKIKDVDGRDIALAVALRTLDIQGATYWLVRLTDISRETVIRQDLIRSHTILNNLDHLIIVADAEAKFTYISPSVKQILGFEPGELLGDGWWKQEFGRQGDVEKMKQYARECASGQREVSAEPYEQEYKDRNGNAQWILWKDVAPGDGTIIGVGYLYTQLRRTEQMRRIIINIAEEAAQALALTDLYAVIHREVTSLIKARNFYIGLETGSEGIYSPYFIDQERPGSILPESGGTIPRDSLSGYTMRLRKAQRVTQPEIEALQRQGALNNYGPMPKMWMGAPLLHDGEVVGLIALVDYDSTSAFSEQDLELLTFVATQIGAVVSRFNQQEKLRLSEERYRLISEASFEGIAMHVNQRVIETNQAYATLFGYSREELIGLEVEKLVHPSSIQMVMEHVRENREALYQFTAQRKDGSTFEAEALGRRLKLEGREVRLVAIRDITERLLAEQRLQSSRFDERFKVFVQHSTEIICILNGLGEVQYISPSVERILGLNPDDLKGISYLSLVRDESKAVADEALYKALEQEGATTRAEYTLTHSDGTLRFVESYYTNLLHDPLVAGVLVSSHDITERVAFERTLRDSEQRFRALFDSSLDAIFVEDRHGQILDANEAAASLQGRPVQELIGMNVQDLVPDDLRNHLDIDMDRWFSGEIKQLEAFAYRRDGTPVPIEIRAVLLNYGGVDAVMFQVRDISERIEAQQKIQRSLALLSATYESTQDGVLVLSSQGHTLSYNEGFLKLWKISRSVVEQGGRTEVFAHMRNETDPSIDFAAIVWNLETQQEERSQALLHLRDGRVLEIYARALGEGPISGMLWFFHDITELKKVERALRSSERRSKALLDAIPDLMYRMRLDGLLLDFKASLGYVPVGRVPHESGRNLREILPPDVAASILEKARHAIESGQVVELEYSLHLPAGNVDFDVRIVRSGSDEALVIERDVTRRKETERELIRRNFELDSFVYRSSHDLKAPLNSIMGLIAILRTETQDDVVIRYLNMMNKSVEKLDSFIRDLTDFSRNERQELGREPVSLLTLLEESLENLRYMESADRVSIQQDIHEEVQLYSDSMRLGIILNNLISNAVKYQNHQEPQPWVKVNAKVTAEQAVILISDNGIGIKPEYMDRMFKLFFRASLQSYGSGLGLYIVKNTVEKLGGTIELASEYGKGSTFTVVIPNSAKS
jgi:PAS domain S-box-containing protein